MTDRGMRDTFYDRMLHGVAYRRRWVVALLLVLVGLSGWRLTRLQLDNNIEHMLPASEKVAEGFRFLRESGFSDRVVLSISLADHQADPGRLMEALDYLEAALPGPLVSEVSTGLPRGGPAMDWAHLLALLPQMTGPARMHTLLRKDHGEAIEQRIGNLYRRLLAPGSSMGQLLAADPFGLAGGVLDDIQHISAAFGYRVKVVGGRLFSRDERHALLILETPVAVTDGFGARALLEHVEACLASAPRDIEALVVAGHRHTVSNEAVIRRDVRRTALAAAAGFLLLLLAVFRDPRAGLLFLIPIAAIVLSIALASLLLTTLSYFILGMSVVIAGIAMDYGIHVYVAQRAAGEKVLSRVAKPVAVGAFTTGGVFAAFFFSSVPGYTQLAYFSLLSLMLCLVLALFLLPHAIQTLPGAWKAWRRPPDKPPRGRRRARTATGIWLIGLALLGWSSSRLVFQRDIEQFDGSEEAVFRDERAFHRIWGGDKRPAMLVVEGNAFEPVWNEYEEVSMRAAEALGEEQVITLAGLWPSFETRRQRLEDWRMFWAQEGPALRARLADAQAGYGFAEDAFDPFFNQLEGSEVTRGLPGLAVFEGLRDRFAIRKGDTFWAVAYVEDTPYNLQRLAPLERGAGDVRVRLVSRNALAGHLSGALAREMRRLAVIAGGLILLPLFVLMRRMRPALVALAPVLTSLAAIAGALPLLGLPLNAASIVAGMIVVGLVIDYGVYMVYHEAVHLHRDAVLSVHLSAATTLVGGSALLLARHPVMYSIGVTLITGISAGYLCSLWVVPALYRLTGPERKT